MEIVDNFFPINVYCLPIIILAFLNTIIEGMLFKIYASAELPPLSTRTCHVECQTAQCSVCGVGGAEWHSCTRSIRFSKISFLDPSLLISLNKISA